MVQKPLPTMIYFIKGGQTKIITLRLTNTENKNPFADFDPIFEMRKKEADIFYSELQEGIETEDARNVQRQAYAGLLWSKQFYYFNVHQWLKGDPAQPPPPDGRKTGRNQHGIIWIIRILSACRTNGNIHGMRPGIFVFTQLLSYLLIQVSPDPSYFCSPGNGICIPTVSCQLMNGLSEM